MSDGKTPRPSSLWGFALSLLACAAAIWMLVKVIEATWGWLLVIIGVIALIATALVLIRHWMNRRYW